MPEPQGGTCPDCQGAGVESYLLSVYGTAYPCLTCNGRGMVALPPEQKAVPMVSRMSIHFVRNPLGSGMKVPDGTVLLPVCGYGTDPGQVVTEFPMCAEVEAPVTCPECLLWIRENAA